MRVLVVGPAGQVGRAVYQAARPRGFEVYGGYASRAPRTDPSRAALLDKTRPETIQAALERFRPDWVIDTGALHNVDYCEQHPDEAFRVNRDGTANLAKAAEAAGARYLFVSTDFVFDGAGHPPYSEGDPTNPLSVYGRSKLDGERLCRSIAPSSIVVRSSVIYSWIPPPERVTSASQKGVNFGSWAVDELAQGHSLRIVEDQIASPTLAEDLGGAIVSLAERGSPGLFHAAGATPSDRYSFTRRLAERLGFDPALVTPVRTADLKQVAARPPFSSLDSNFLARTTGHNMLSLDEALVRFERSWRLGAADKDR